MKKTIDVHLKPSTALLIAGLTLSMAGCTTLGDNPKSSEASAAAKQKVGDLPAQWANMQQTIGPVETDWIAKFNDPTLDALVIEAQANNLNLQAAAANVRNAQALASQAASALSPQVGASIGGNQGGPLEGSSAGAFSAGLQAKWEIDLWGRVASGALSAQESAEAAKADYVFSKYSLAAAVAKAYFISIEGKQQLAIAKQTVDTIQKTLDIVQLQFDNGVANQQNLSLTKSELANANDSLIATQGAQREAVRALELLLGRYPSAELSVDKPLPQVPLPPGVGIPSDLLERRPDLIAAERKVAAAFNALDQAKAAKLPSISLSSDVGGSSTALSDLLNPANLAWKAIGSIAAPLIDGGRLDAQVASATAQQEAAIAGYAQAALNAFSEVENALDQGTILKQRHAALSESLKEAETALRIANLQFKEGEIALLDVLQIQQRVFSARRNLLSVSRTLNTQYIDLSLALGGDWQ